jgi:DNA sulfur modification protein DndB
MERTTLAPRSRRLFTLSAIYTASAALLANIEVEGLEPRAALAARFWETVGAQLPQWALVQKGNLTAGEVRQDFIHTHGVVLQALGRVGNSLLHHRPKDWRKVIPKIAGIDWRRGNAALWEGRAMIGGRVSKSQQNVLLTTTAIKAHLGLGLSADELRAEEAYQRGDQGHG